MDKTAKRKEHSPENFNGAKLVGVFEPGSSAWHEARADGIGGSDIGAICGLNRYESAFSLYAKKTGLVEPEVVDNWPVRFGKAFEEPLLDLFAKEHPELDIYTTGTYRSEDYPFMLANPDALAWDKERKEWIVVEIKTAREYWQEVPPSYEAQIIHYMTVLKIKRAVIAGIVGWDWVEHWYDFDNFQAEAQVQGAKQFWEAMKEGEAPAWDGSDATYEALRKTHPDIDQDLEVEISGGHDLVLAKRELDLATAKYNEARNDVMALMGKAKNAYVEVEGKKHIIATRRAKAGGRPFLLVRDK